MVSGFLHNYHMGSAAEYTRKKANITREEQDQFAFNSHKKAVAAMQAGKFKAEIFDIAVPQRKGDPKIFNVDECPRADVSIESLAKLRPHLKKTARLRLAMRPV